MLHESLGSRLRQERERRKIALSVVAEKTKILGALLEGLERDDVSRWPSGLYRRSFIRAYAAAIGLDPEPVVREFIERFPDPNEPIAATAPNDVAPLSVAPAPAAPAPTSVVPGADSRAGLRLTLADAPTSFIGGRLLTLPGRRLAAAACDAAVLVAIAGAFLLTLGEFWLPLSIAIAFYYLGGVLILGNSPGVCLFAPRPADPGGTSRWDEEVVERVSAAWRSIVNGTAWASDPDGRRADR